MQPLRPRPAENGVILIALLWILTALAVIGLSFSRESFVEVAAARNMRDMAASYYAARAGMMVTIYQIVKKRLTVQLKQLELNEQPDPIDLGLVKGRIGDSEYTVEIQDESGKINLNQIREDQLRTLVGAVGIDPHDADIIVDSLLDWIDADPGHRANGAEDEYYQSQDPPYKAKNGRLDTVEELLLVRGMTRDYYYGHAEKTPEGSVVSRYGLSRYLSVYSNSSQINVNFAPVEVLLSIPGMTPEAAQAIYERRKVKPFASVEEITRELPVTLGANTLPMLTTNPTGIYTLTASAHRENSKAFRVIRAVVMLLPQSQDRYRIVYWNENIARM